MIQLTWVEWLGYGASVLVLISMLMSSILKLRILNLSGALFFTLYGFLIDALPVAFLNLFIVFANIYYLNKIVRIKENFSTIDIEHDHEYLLKFLDFYKNDILNYFPKFSEANIENNYSFLVLRNMTVVGLFLAKKMDEKSIYINLDYVIPEYRDLKPGKYLFHDKLDFFKNEGFHSFITSAQTLKHKNYLLKMGFKPELIHGSEFYVFTWG